MSADQRPVGEDDLQACIDGRLDPARIAVVEAYLAANGEAAAKVAADIDGAARLRARLAPIAAEPIPARLRVANVAAGRHLRLRRRFGAIAAAFAWLVVGGAGGWLGRDWSRPAYREPAGSSAATRDAVAAFRTFSVEVAHPVEVRADQKPHLVQWLSRRLNRTVLVPDLSPQGFQLLGGRLLPTDGAPAALLMYEDDRGTRLTLYSRAGSASEGMAAFRSAREGDVAVLAWTDAGQSYVVTARAEPARLQAVADTIETQLRGAESRPL